MTEWLSTHACMHMYNIQHYMFHYGILYVMYYHIHTASVVAQLVKNPPAMWETWVWSLGWEGPLEKGKATHSSILAWRIPWSVVHGIKNSWTQLSDFHFHMPESSSVHWWGFQTVVALAGYLADTNIFRSFLEGWTKVPKTLWIICLEVMWNMGAEYRIKSEGS